MPPCLPLHLLFLHSFLSFSVYTTSNLDLSVLSQFLSCLFLKLYNFFCPSFFSSIPHSYGWVKGLQNADSHQMKYTRKGGWGELARWLCQHSLTTRCWAWGAGLRYILTHSYFHTEMFICLCLQVQKASLGVVNFVTVTLYSKFDILLD